MKLPRFGVIQKIITKLRDQERPNKQPPLAQPPTKQSPDPNTTNVVSKNMIFDEDEEWPAEYTKNVCINSTTYRITCILLPLDTLESPGIRKLTITALPATENTPNLPVSCLEAHLLPKTTIPTLLSDSNINPDITRNLRQIYNHNFHLRPEITEHRIRKGTGVWGHELDGKDLVFVNYVWTAISQRSHGIASQMVSILKEVAGNHGIEYIVMQPSFFEAAAAWSTDGDETWRPWHDVEFTSTPEHLKQDICTYNPKYKSWDDLAVERSKRFWRSCGARRIGLTPLFGIAIPESHPSHSLPASKDLEERGLKPRYICTNNSPHNLKECQKKAASSNSASTFLIDAAKQLKPRLLNTHLKTLGPQKLLEEIKATYEYQPLVHIAIAQGRVDTIRWFRNNLRGLFECVNYEGFTAGESLRRDIEMEEERRFYGEEGRRRREDGERREYILELLEGRDVEGENRDEEFENWSDFSDDLS